MPRHALLLSLALVAVLLVPGAAWSAPPPGGEARAGNAWLSLVAEARTTCGVKKDHTAWCWGRNTNGQLGDGTTASRSVPTRIKGSWSAISIGSTYPGGETVCAVRTDGAGYCWGWSRWGQTGAHGKKDVLRPSKLPGRWRSVTAAGDFTCGIRTDGSGWCWGRNFFGQLGHGNSQDSSVPVRLPGVWKSLSLYADTACGIQTDATGWCWGENDDGRAGVGTTEVRVTTPALLAGAWRELTVDGLNTCGVQTDGTGWCWGYNASGNVGDGTTDDRLVPTQVVGAWRSITPGVVTCGIRVDGTGWCWGDGTTLPAQVPGTWASLASNLWTTCGVQVGGSGWCWGDNTNGQVGDGTKKGRSTPTRLAGRWSTVGSRGDLMTVGIRTDGSGWTWGYNSNGQVGDGTTKDRLTPYRLR